MKASLSSSALVAISLLSLTSASGTLKLDISGKREFGTAHALRKRDSSSGGTVTAPLTENQYFVQYYADVKIGSPPQEVHLIVDTGSSDVWTLAASAPICQSQDGCPFGTFDSTKSSTFVDNGQGKFQDQYADGSSTTGDYFTDNFSIGGASVESFEMGLALNSSIGKGIMGIAFDSGEGGGTVSYPNLVDTMVNQSVIATQAYSLWLNDLDARGGTLLFGGIDTGKYSGNLANIAMYASADSGVIDRFTVAFTSFSVTSPSGTDNLTPAGYAEPVVLDSGTTMTFFPDDLAQSIYNIVGATYDSSVKATLCPCSAATVQGTLNFGFAGPNGVTIQVPISEMVYPFFADDGSQANFTNGQPACNFGIEPASSLGNGAPLLFGDTLLRSAYVVYDLANNRIGLAQTKFNSTDSNIVAFESLSAAIPSATTVQNELQVTQTANSGNVGPTAAGTGGAPTGAAPTGTGPQYTGKAGPAFASATAAAKKSAAVGGPRPFAWDQMGLMGLTIGLVVMGGTTFLL